MEFLYSNLPPIKTKYPTFYETFYSLIPEATRLDIAVGYITADSLVELHQAIIQNSSIETLNLVIGMHRWEKFTRMEYEAAMQLNEFLLKEKRGEVRLVTPFRFHGKLYSYSNAQGAFAGIIGSNNLSSIVDSRNRIYEASTLFRERDCTVKMREFIESLIEDATDNIADCNIVGFKNAGRLLEDHENVEEVTQSQLSDCISDLSDEHYLIPLVKDGSVPQKSNLNTFFGKGRLNKDKGVVRPRHWYEVEIIVPKTITCQNGYPIKGTPSAVFEVITDDRWKFSCKVSGDYSKNLRSEDDLKILGKWIKGRLENHGALKIGDPITPDTFNRYGRDNFEMTKTNTPNLWYLDFGVE